MDIILISILKRILFSFKFLVFFLGPGSLYSYIAKKIYWKKLELYADLKGYHHEPGRFKYDFGELHWECRGMPVKVRICYDHLSSGPWISVGLKTGKEILELETGKPLVDLMDDWEEFTPENRAFNYLYRTRRVDSNYAEKLLNAPRLFDAIVNFYRKWVFHLSNDVGTNGLVVDGEKVVCTFGPSMLLSLFPYISPEKIERILPDMIKLAEKFDAAVQ
ncbi:MAG: hypothetical protein GY754_31425 [bacterium]|nr:hypothetical protein [bacterium]